MKTKFRTLLNVLFMLIMIFGMVLGHFQIGKAQSGTDWSVPVNLSLSGVASNPLAVVDLIGTIHAIWIDEIDGYKYSQNKDGVTWTLPLSVRFPFDPKDPAPVFIADSKGSISVFWINKQSELYYAQVKSENFGDPSQWVTTQLSRSAANFDVVLDVTGALHLTYIENVTNELGAAGVYFRQSIVGGGVWSNPVSIYQSEYFRATTSLTTNVRIAVTNQPSKQKIYISWDNRPQKRIYLASSGDNGKNWSTAQQFKGPDDTGGFDDSFNISVWADGPNLLLIWQVGVPGADKCSVYSQFSKDGGATWGDTLDLFGVATVCPFGIGIVGSQNGKVMVLLNEAYNPTLIAWDGIQWSAPQPQIQLPPLSNPATHNAIQLGCRQDIFYMDILLVIGCDQSGGGDIWFLSRQLIPLSEWFSPFSLWDELVILEGDGQVANDLSSASDASGNIHAVWSETPPVENGSKPYIQYSKWDGTQWSNPETIIRNLDGVPLQLTMYLDSQNRLMLAWVDGTSGDVMFSVSELDQAGLTTTWGEAVSLPSPSQLNSAPDIVADSAGRIVLTYAVFSNENRGIYLVQSTDNGITWSPHLRAFDGVQAQWELIDHPKIALSGDGVLQLIFTRQTTMPNQPMGLYYSRSLDGGVTWSDPQIVSEGNVTWSDVVAYGDQTVHRFWQEKNSLVVANLSQVSQNGGAAWGKLLDMTGVSDNISPVAIATDGMGQLYFVELIKKNAAGFLPDEQFLLHGWSWDGAQWHFDATRELRIRGQGTRFSLTAGLTSNGYLGVLMSAGYTNSKGEAVNEVISLNRFLKDIAALSRVTSVVIPTPVFNSNQPAIGMPTAMLTPAVDLSVLGESNDPSEGMTKNIIGIGLIMGVVVITLLMLLKRKPQISQEMRDDN